MSLLSKKALTEIGGASPNYTYVTGNDYCAFLFALQSQGTLISDCFTAAR